MGEHGRKRVREWMTLKTRAVIGIKTLLSGSQLVLTDDWAVNFQALSYVLRNTNI